MKNIVFIEKNYVVINNNNKYTFHNVEELIKIISNYLSIYNIDYIRLHKLVRSNNHCNILRLDDYSNGYNDKSCVINCSKEYLIVIRELIKESNYTKVSKGKAKN